MECSAALAYKEVPSVGLLLPSRSSQGEFPWQQPGSCLGSGTAAGVWSGCLAGSRSPFTRSAWILDGVNERMRKERTEGERRFETGTGGNRQAAGFPLQGWTWIPKPWEASLCCFSAFGTWD